MAEKRNSQKYMLKICTLALLCAMQIVFARFLVIPIGTSLRFSLSFIPVVIAAKRFGIVGGVTVYGLGDFLGALIFPTGGAFQIGFTVTAVVSGFIFGAFLGKGSEKLWHKLFTFDKKGIIPIVSAVLSSQLICSLLLNSFWLSYYYGMPFFARLVTRIPQILIIGSLQIVFMVLFLEKINYAIKKVV